jgi:hypothetical protein
MVDEAKRRRLDARALGDWLGCGEVVAVTARSARVAARAARRDRSRAGAERRTIWHGKPGPRCARGSAVRALPAEVALDRLA